MREISLTVASKEFSELASEMEQGESFVITRRGRPIAKLTSRCADRPAPNGRLVSTQDSPSLSSRVVFDGVHVHPMITFS